MKNTIIIIFTVLCICKQYVQTLNLPGPLVYVVTPSPRPKTDEGRSAPFYYHNWMRRMDSPRNATTTTTTEANKTPDLIFAEFESGNNVKSIRKLLEKEKIEAPSSTTTTRPIYVPDQSVQMTRPVAPVTKEESKTPEPDRTDYFALYSNMYGNNDIPAPVYSPSTTSTTTPSTTTSTTPPSNVENIWHIIDSQKHDEHIGNWEEQHIVTENTNDETAESPQTETENANDDETTLDDNFVYPGFGANPGVAENESRAIRTEPNIRFPYVNLKPFQMKVQKNPLFNGFSNSKKGNNMYTNLDNFQEVKNPVRGEAQDVVPNRQLPMMPIDRYNPAQPYLPQPTYGTKSKQSSPVVTPMKAVASLVPPPPPPPPKVTDGNFPIPTNYEPFPPYAPSGPPVDSAPPVPAPKPSQVVQPPADTPDYSSPDSSSDSDSDGPPVDLGYRYKPPSPPAQPFIPTIPPFSKPYKGYSYDKPSLMAPPIPDDSMEDKPVMDMGGYHYNKPEPPVVESKPYGHDTHAYGPDYPELIFDHHHGPKGGVDMKDAGMMPPPPPPDMKPDLDSPPSDDHGFPHDFPGDFKFHHDFDDHDHYHYHHPTTTTTTTTEMPRVNRYSYYYLGKKLYYLPLYFSVYFIVYVGALIIKAVLRHKIVYPNSWRPNDTTATFFSKRSIESWDLSNENLHEITGKVTHAIAVAGEKYLNQKKKK